MEKYKNILIWILLIIVGIALLKYLRIIDFSNLFSITGQGSSSSSVSSSIGGGVP